VLAVSSGAIPGVLGPPLADAGRGADADGPGAGERGGAEGIRWACGDCAGGYAQQLGPSGVVILRGDGQRRRDIRSWLSIAGIGDHAWLVPLGLFAEFQCAPGGLVLLG
jgi:hypothetical protein